MADFAGGEITSNAGALLLGQLDRGLGLVRRFAACFRDRRDPRFVEHRVATLVGQRVFGLALGYEDLADHDALRKDPDLAALHASPPTRRGIDERLILPRMSTGGDGGRLAMRF